VTDTGDDAKMLRRVGDKAVRRTAVCLQVDGGCFKHILYEGRPKSKDRLAIKKNKQDKK
jgi:hypothetical protein